MMMIMMEVSESFRSESLALAVMPVTRTAPPGYLSGSHGTVNMTSTAESPVAPSDSGCGRGGVPPSGIDSESVIVRSESEVLPVQASIYSDSAAQSGHGDSESEITVRHAASKDSHGLPVLETLSVSLLLPP
jgi:hypothetical protein